MRALFFLEALCMRHGWGPSRQAPTVLRTRSLFQPMGSSHCKRILLGKKEQLQEDQKRTLKFLAERAEGFYHCSRAGPAVINSSLHGLYGYGRRAYQRTWSDLMFSCSRGGFQCRLRWISKTPNLRRFSGRTIDAR